jgi:hypothetical protein
VKSFQLPLSTKEPVKFVDSINNMIKGRTENVSRVTLTANAASTTVNNSNISENSEILLSPKTANAAAALATTYIPEVTILNGSFVIQHANNAQTDKTFGYVWVG